VHHSQPEANVYISNLPIFKPWLPTYTKSKVMKTLSWPNTCYMMT